MGNLAGTITGTATFGGTLRVPGWVQNFAGVYELLSSNAAERFAFIADIPMLAGFQGRVQINDPDEEVEILIRSSPDGNTAYQVYTDSSGSNLRLRKITFGAVAAHVATVTYAAAGLTAAQPATIDVRVTAGKVEVFVNENETVILTHTIGTDLEENDRWGFSGVTSGTPFAVDASVLRAERCELVPQIEERADVLVAIAGGQVWVAVDETNITRISADVMVGVGDVDVTSYDQKLYMVDGKHFKIFDAKTMLVSNLVPTVGTLPGATAGVDGSTTVKLIETHHDRLYCAGVDDDPQNIFAPAIGDPLDWDTSSVTRGRAFILSAERSGRVGEPILGMISASTGTLIIGTTGKIWEWRGDFAIGQPLLTQMASEGISGKDSMFVVEQGRVLIHGPSGLLQVQEGVIGSQNISRPVLTTLIQYPTRDRALRNVQVIRDTQRHGVFIGLTKRDGSQATHLWYDERVAGFGNLGEQGSIGGFFPWQFEANMGPTATVVWKGRPIFGTEDGLILQADETTRHDNFRPFSCRVPTGLFQAPTPDHEVLLETFLVEFAPGASQIEVRVFGGANAEAVYDEDQRIQLLRKVVGTGMIRTIERVRCPALYIEVKHELTLGGFRLEGVYAQAIVTRLARRWGQRAPLVPSLPHLPADRCYPVSGSGSGGSPLLSGPGPGPSGSPGDPSGSDIGSPMGSPVPSGSLGSGSFQVSGSVGNFEGDPNTTAQGDGPTFDFYTGGEDQD